MDNPQVSIVVPVYNVAPYLSTFIDSILNQTYRNWELLLVDDGATDGSGVICDRFAASDLRIRVYHKPNGGVSSARNVALQKIDGDWVLMPDPDDVLPQASLQTLLSYAADDIDLISASYTWYENDELKPSSQLSLDGVYSRDKYVAMIGTFPQPRNLNRRCCNKLFRASIIRENQILFHEDLFYGEAILYCYQFLEKCRGKVQCLSYDMYCYCRRTTGAALSLQNRYTPKSAGKIDAVIRAYSILEQMNAPSDVKGRMRNEIYDAYAAVVQLIAQSDQGQEDIPAYRKQIRPFFTGTEFLLKKVKFYLRNCKMLCKRGH